MSIKLKKKGKITLRKEVKYALLGLGWDVPNYRGPSYDFDLTLMMINERGLCEEDTDMVFYNNLNGPDGCVHHTGDDRDGSTSDGGDDEQIRINFDAIPERIKELVVVITLFKAKQRNQTFNGVKSGYVRVCSIPSFDASEEEAEEEVYFDLTKQFGYETGMIAAKITRVGNSWDFEAVGEEFSGGLEEMCERYGLDVED